MIGKAKSQLSLLDSVFNRRKKVLDPMIFLNK